jgi:hypothetical protein
MQAHGTAARCRFPHRLLLHHFGVALIICLIWADWSWAQDPTQTHFRLQMRATVEKRLKAFAVDNQVREDIIRRWLAQSGCRKANLSEQQVRFGLPPNVICVIPGETNKVIVVGAHTDKVTSAGDGVVDNWSGAALLPSLLFSLGAMKRRHTFVLVGFTAEEKGLVGSRYYADHLSDAQRAHIEAVVNFDSLGLGPTEVWSSRADKALLDALNRVAAANKIPVTAMNPENGASADSESFARYQIPRITLHSVTKETWPVLHSARDTMAAVKMDDYYESYKLIAEYLAYLDDAFDRPRALPANKSAQ